VVAAAGVLVVCCVSQVYETKLFVGHAILLGHQPIATDRVVWSVCLSVGHVVEHCNNSWTHQDADWRVDLGGLKKLYYMGSISQRGRSNVLVVQPIEKHCKSLLQCTQQKVNNGVSATAAANCIAPIWLVSH